MSFRKEIKSTLSKSKLNYLLKWIKKNGGTLLYPERIINSVYFDNSNLNMFHESVEGILPRKKIRLRLYKNENLVSNFTKKSYLEYKISSVEGRFKISKKTSKEFANTIFIYDKNYGICEPKLNVIYKRSYYKIKNIRLTVDREITYKRIKFKKILPYKIKDVLNVVELKFKDANFNKEILNFFPFQYNRFSKYCRGIEFTQKKICDEII